MAEQRIALCAIVRNEIRSLVEWLAYHKTLEFTEIVICDNASADARRGRAVVRHPAGGGADWPFVEVA